MSQIVIDFIIQNTTKIATALFGAVAFATLVNVVVNPYYSQSKKLKKGIVLLKKCAFGQSVFRFVESLPKQYLNQWKCFTKTPNVYPSEIFEFATKKPKVVLSWLYFCLGISAVGMASMFFVDQNSDFLLLALSLTVCLCLSQNFVKAIRQRERKKMEKIFDKWLCHMDAFFGKDFDFENMGRKIDDKDLNDVIESFDLLKKSTDTATLEKIAKLLQSKGLNGQRTVAQQQRLNLALNQLMVQSQEKIEKTSKTKPIE